MVFEAFGLDPDQTKSLLFWVLGIFALYTFMQTLNGNMGGNNTHNPHAETNPHTEWINKGFGLGYGQMNPAQRFPELMQEFGPPSVFDPKPGGGAIWYKKDLENCPFEMIEIKDEQIPHNKPAKHVDFLYSWYKVDVPTYKIGGLHKISESIAYDPLKKLMVARCHDMKPNVVTHWIVKQYANDELTIDEAVGMYGPMIMELMTQDSDDRKYQELLSEL